MESGIHTIVVEGRWFVRHDSNADTDTDAYAYSDADPNANAHTNPNGFRVQPV